MLSDENVWSVDLWHAAIVVKPVPLQQIETMLKKLNKVARRVQEVEPIEGIWLRRMACSIRL